MSKKDFTGGINSLLGATSKEKNIEITWEKQASQEPEFRATYIINRSLHEKLKAIAYWDRITLTEVANTALREFIARYERKNGQIKEIPNR